MNYRRQLLALFCLPLLSQAEMPGYYMLHLGAGDALVSNADISSYADMSSQGFDTTEIPSAAYLVGGLGIGFWADNHFFHEAGFELGPHRDVNFNLRKNGVMVSSIRSSWNSSDYYYMAGCGYTAAKNLRAFACLKFSAELFNGKHEETNNLQNVKSSFDMGAAGYGLTPLVRLDYCPSGSLSLGLECGYSFVSMGDIATTNMQGAYTNLKYSFNKNPDGSKLGVDNSGPFLKLSLGWSLRRSSEQALFKASTLK